MSQVNTELGYSSTAQISLNDAAVRSLAGVPSGAISMQNLQGKSSAFAATISSNQTNLNLATWAAANGWNGTAPATITIATGVWVYSTSTGTPALTTGNFPNGLTIVNNGFIAGMGGAGGPAPGNGFPGGNAISLGCSLTINNTNGSAYIGGGGGGGASAGGGGGGAGGGAGGASSSTTGSIPGGAGGGINSSGGNGGANPALGSGAYSGGGGGRIFPGVGGAARTSTTDATLGGLGGGAGGSGGLWRGVVCPGGRCAPAGNAGAGGGGWGASGGTTYNFLNTTTSGAGGSANAAGGNVGAPPQALLNTGGAGGKAVALNGFAVTWTSGNTTRVYGAVS